MKILWIGAVLLVAIGGLFTILNRAQTYRLEANSLRRVTSRGGQVELNIPSQWRAEPEDDYMLFFDPHPDSGGLRISVFTFQWNGPKGQRIGDILLDTQKKRGVSVPLEDHPSGGKIARSIDESVEGGTPIVLTVWEWEHLQGDQVVLTIATFTLRKDQMADPEQLETIELIDREIRRAKVVQS